jgi:glycosyltransferase involved in cell wall biosynthesis
MEISVLIPTYNDAEVLPATLAPLLGDPAASEIVVVADGSEDGSVELLQSLAKQDPRLRPFHIENRGRPGARQFALEQARSDVVLLLDADVIGQDGLVSAHAAWHESGARRLVAGYMPTTVPPRRPGSFVLDLYAKYYEMVCDDWDRDAGSILKALWGGNISLPRAALQDAGGCDARAGVAYADDLELGLRLRSVGLEAVFDRRLRAEHRVERSVDGFLANHRKNGRDCAIVDRLHPGVVEFPDWRDGGAGGFLRRAARRARGYGLVSRLGRGALWAAGALRLWTLETRLGMLLGSVEMQRGMQEQREPVPASGRQVFERSEPMGGDPGAPLVRAQQWQLIAVAGVHEQLDRAAVGS